MKISTDLVKSLVEEKDPVDVVGNELVNIWHGASKKDVDIKDFYDHTEDDARSFEEFILKSYDEFYDLLAKVCTQHKSIFDLHEGASILIMDGMSLREGALICKMLKDNYRAELRYGFSAIPSDTSQFREKNAISGFKEINDADNIRLKGDEKIVWSQFPDVMLDKIQVGRTIISSLENMYKRCEDIVRTVVETLENERIIITSDHGYTRTEPKYTFSVQGKSSRRLKDLLGGKRYTSMDDVDAEDLMREGYVKEINGYYIVKSRYVWPVPGRSSIYLHGGISLMECFTPVIEVTK